MSPILKIRNFRHINFNLILYSLFLPFYKIWHSGILCSILPPIYQERN